MLPRRMGRPGLLGTMARTAVITGTATAVSGRVQRRGAQREMEREANAQAQQQALVDQAAAQAAAQNAYAQQPPPSAPAATDRVAQLTALADLKAQGLLSDAEFATEKARILNS
ncbi:SHOCT domain-containing protein [Streptomyces sp. Q6]|uniref:SHOCT domain-containing protein n=1 Tax=Streptomyces citrinus TaxID=3118173 RepID=A0ACD5AK77_9ACTN